ncbi:MAG: hypothetical protein K2L50_01830 [Bacteroidales bacterium]|nr:hypothetical protein [Bacteroidales bacterium]
MVQLTDPRLTEARWANTTGTETTVSTGTDTGTTKWWQNSDIWGAIGNSFQGLTDMFGSIFAGAGNKQTDTVANAGANYIVPSQNQQKSNTAWLWIVGVVALVLVVFILFKKFK